MSEIKVTPPKTNRPDGLSIDRYKGHEKWSYRRWAWEFLRRNKDFIKACEALDRKEGTEEEIATFCSSKFAVTFPLTTKIDVKGDNQHPIYKWLTSKALNGVNDYTVNWNFNKFMLDENGQLIGYFSSRINPMDSDIINLLK